MGGRWSSWVARTAIIGLLGALAGWLALGPLAAHAATTSLQCGDVGGLKSAIENDNGVGGGTIDLNSNNAPNCIYQLPTSTVSDDGDGFGPSGLPLIASAIVINGNQSTIARASNAGAFRVVEVFGGTLTLNGVTVTAGVALGSSSRPGSGGGILDNGGILILSNSSVSGNLATGSDAEGGGIDAVFGASVTLSASSLSGNTASSTNATGSTKGGGIAVGNGGVLEVDNSTVSGNTSSANLGLFSPAQGGGISVYPQSSLTVNASTISANAANGGEGDGGGIFITDSQLTLSGVTVRGNAATGNAAHGGGLLNSNGANVTSTVSGSTISGNTVSGTVEAVGAGIFTDNGSTTGALALTNTQVTGNQGQVAGSQGTAWGGGVFNNGGFQMTGSTLASNSMVATQGTAQGGGLFNQNGGSATLTATPVTQNSVSAPHHAAAGGGIYNNGGTVAVDRKAVTKNHPDNCAPTKC